ncbi:hypothetical protein F4678DRAFT_426497 [Xylaria arbuscula]|nr:hypothetical protein F4678DRAFT_426497 [Xylaria arbuscula]
MKQLTSLLATYLAAVWELPSQKESRAYDPCAAYHNTSPYGFTLQSCCRRRDEITTLIYWSCRDAPGPFIDYTYFQAECNVPESIPLCCKPNLPIESTVRNCLPAKP